jgi:hypothetical protein
MDSKNDILIAEKAIFLVEYILNSKKQSEGEVNHTMSAVDSFLKCYKVKILLLLIILRTKFCTYA